ncbi:MAG TPA: phosphatase PAP2 family protein [Gaiellaceae bacterium]|nr:phosphatase PAP2 family protein [Gaiellaceae bacterium]
MEADTQVVPPLPITSDERERATTTVLRSGPPVIEPAPAGPAARFAERFGPENPIRIFLLALLTGYALLVTGMVFLGFTLIYLVLPVGGLREADEDVSTWLADNRTPTLEDASWVGSTLAGGHVIPFVIGLCLVFFLFTRRWLLAAFVLFAVVLESGTYRLTSWIVERERPDVKRLESLPVDASYPSGHTAASVALYGGLLILLASKIDNVAVRVAALLVGIAIPLFVAWSRMYRGMHHLSDVGAGMLMGLGALAVIVFVARATRSAARRRAEVRAT